MADYKYKLDIDVQSKGLKETREELEKLQQGLKEAKKKGKTKDFVAANFGKAIDSGEAAKKTINRVIKALDELDAKGKNLTIADLAKFNNDLKLIGSKVKALDKYLEGIGRTGATSMGQLSKATYDLGYQVDKVEDKFSKLGDQIQHELVDNVVRMGFDSVGSAISKAVYFTKDLNRTLTDIQIVSGKSASEMASFAEQSSKAARALGSTTDEFANASLIFFQQGGYTAGEVQKLAEATTIASNITRQSTDVVADQLTALVNAFGTETTSVMNDIVDVFAKIGAVSGSNFEELATATQKFASQAKVAGYEGAQGIQEMGAQIATVVETTRQSADSIGIGFKTILSRIQGIKEDKSGEMVTKLSKSVGQLNSELKQLGAEQFEIFDQFGDLRGADELINDLGNTWHRYGDQLSEATKKYVMQEVAGVEQAARLSALFDNWDRYLEILGEAQNAQGTALQQQAVYMDSIDAKASALRTSFEDMILSLNVDTLIKGTLDGLTNITDAFGGIIDQTSGFGGVVSEVLGASNELGETIGSWVPLLGGALVIANKFFSSSIASRIAMHQSQREYIEQTRQQMEQMNVVDKRIMETKERIRQTAGFDRSQEYGKAQQAILDNSVKQLHKEEKKYIVLKQSLDELKGQKRISEEQIALVDKYHRQRLELKKVETEILTGQRSLKDILNDLSADTRLLLNEEGKITKENQKQLDIEKQTTDEILKQVRIQTSHKEGDENKARGKMESSGELLKLDEVRTLDSEIEALDRKNKSINENTKQMERQARSVDKTRKVMGLLTAATLGGSQIIAGFGEVMDSSANKSLGFAKILTGVGTVILSLLPTLTTFVQTAFAGLLAPLAPFLPWIAAATIAIGALITVTGGFKSEAERTAKANQELTKTFVEQKDRIDSLKKSLDGVSDSYKELSETGMTAQEILASGNEELIAKYEQYAETVKEVNASLILGYDEQGRAIIDLTKSQKGMTNELDKQSQLNYQMMASNSKGFIGQMSAEYKSATNTLEGLRIEHDELQKQLSSAMESGNTNKISSTVAKINELNVQISQQQEVLSNNAALVHSNVIEPFFKGSEEVKSFNDKYGKMVIDTENGSVSLGGAISTVVLSTEALNKAVQSGDVSRANEILGNAKNAYEVLNKELKNAGESAETLMTQFVQLPPHIQQAALQLQGAFNNVDLNVLEEADTKIKEILSTEKSIGDVIGISDEEVNLSLIADVEEKISNARERIKELANETDRNGEIVAKNREEYNDLLKTVGEYEEQLENLNDLSGDNVDSLKATEEAFEDLIDSMTETTDGLIEVSNSYNDFLEMLNDMDVGTEAYDEVLNKATMMYAELMENDEAWFEQFKASNSAWVEDVEEATGLNLEKYQTLEDLRTAAEAEGHNIRLQGTLFASQAELDAWRQAKYGEMLSAYEAAQYSFNAQQVSINSSIGLYNDLKAAGFSTGDAIKIVFASISDAVSNAVAGAVNTFTGNIASALNWIREEINSLIKAFNSINPFFQTSLIKGNVKGTSFNTNKNSAGALASDKAQGQTNNQGSVMGNVKPPKPSTGGTGGKDKPDKLKPNTGGNGGSGGKDKDKGNKDKDKDIKDAELNLDPLYEYNNALKLVENEIDILKQKEKDLFGKDLIANLQQQNELLAKKLQILKSEATVIDQQMSNQKDMLSQKGFTFDASGMITNYNEMIEKLTNQANAKTGEAKEQAIADLKQIQETVKDYDKLLTDTSAKLQTDMIKIQQELQENYQKQIEVVIDVNLDFSKAYEKIYKFQEKFNEGFDKTDESLKNMGEYAESLMGDMKTMEDAINHIANDANLTEKQKGEMLKKYINEYMDAAENLDDVIKDMGEKITESLEEGLELIEKTAEGYEKIKDYAEEYSDLLKDIYGPAAMNDIMALYDVQIEAQKGIMDALKEQQALAQQYVNALEPGSEEWKKAKEELDEINMEIANNTLGLLDLMRSKMEDFFDLSREALEQDIFGGSLDDVEEAWDRINKQQEKYVSTSEKVAKIGKLQAQIQEEIAKTNDPKKKAQLQKFIDEELGALKEKDKLTEKEVERAEKLYILMLKQQALQNQEMTAMMARLVRDESGNWSYEYVQDVNKVNEAQKDLADSLEDLMNSDKDNLKENQEEMLDLYKQYFDDLEKLQEKAMAGEFESPEAFDKALEDLNKNFMNQFGQLEKEQENLLNNMTQSSMAYLFNMYKQNGGQLGIFSSETEGVIGGLMGALESGNVSWTDIIKGNYDLIAKELGITKEEAQKAIEEMTSSIQEDFEESNAFIKGDYEDLKNKVQNATADMSKAFADYFNGVAENMGNQKDAINNLNTALGQQKDQIDKVTQSVKDEAKAIIDQLIPSYNALKDKYDKEVNPKTQDFINKLKDSITQMKNSTSSISGKDGLNNALDSLSKSFTDSKNKANELIGSAANNTGLKGMEKSAIDAYGKITTLTGTTTRNNISSTKSAIDGVNSSVGGVNSSLSRMGSSAVSGVQGVINELNKIPARKETVITLKTRDKIKSKKRTGQGNDHTEFTSYNGLKKYGSYGVLNVGDWATFKSGGYTGNWNNSEGVQSDKDKGKLAVLHQKELVLNAEDTKNLLDAVKINREAFANLGQMDNGVSNITSNSTTGDTIIQVDNLELPNVSNAETFLKELKELPNRAIQYKYSKKS